MLEKEEENQTQETQRLGQEENQNHEEKRQTQDETKGQTLEETQSCLTQEEGHPQMQTQVDAKSQTLEEIKGQEQGETKSVTQEEAESQRQTHDEKQNRTQEVHSQIQAHDEKQNHTQEAHSPSQAYNEKQNHTLEAHSQSQAHDEKQNHTQEAHSPSQAYNEKQNHTQEAHSQIQAHDEKQNHTQEAHSQSQDEENIKLLSVSVTFKSQPKSGECCVNGNDSESLPRASPQTSDREQDHDEEGSDVESKQLTAPPVTPSLDCVTPSLSCVTYEDPQAVNKIHEVVSPGWKGFSNNIYIQPIIVRNVNNKSIREKNVTFENNSNSSMSDRRKSDILRKQMRLRQSSHWISTHNERFNKVGSLKISEESSEETKMVKVSSNETGKPNLYNVRKKIRKGFVCRSWSADFLPNEKKGKDEVENSTPLMVSRFVDRLRRREEASTDERDHELRKTRKKTPELENENNNNVEKFKRDGQMCECQRVANSSTINKSVAIEAVCNGVNSKEKSVTKPNVVHDTHSEPKPPSKSALKHMLHCSGTEVTMTRGVVLSLRTYWPKGPRRSGVRFHSAVPIKSFPPIDPLDGVWDRGRDRQANKTSKEKGSLSSRRGNQTTPLARPHTIETAFIGKSLTRHNKLVQRSSVYNMYDTHAQQNVNFSFHQTDMEERSAHAYQLYVPRGSPRDVTHGYASHDNRFQTFNDAAQHLRSYSEPPRSLASPDHCQKLNHKSTHAHPQRRASCKNRTPVLSDEIDDDVDDDVDEDDSVSGLGSEVEYSNNGATKLDVYLNPRVSRQDVFKT